MLNTDDINQKYFTVKTNMSAKRKKKRHKSQEKWKKYE